MKIGDKEIVLNPKEFDLKFSTLKRLEKNGINIMNFKDFDKNNFLIFNLTEKIVASVYNIDYDTADALIDEFLDNGGSINDIISEFADGLYKKNFSQSQTETAKEKKK